LISASVEKPANSCRSIAVTSAGLISAIVVNGYLLLVIGYWFSFKT
jgi:CHASE2 domain-containing sensor protein